MTAPVPRLRLYHYWRSSSSWRVRWAFAFKGVESEMVPIDLLSGESESPEHLARNPAGFVPALEFIDEENTYLTESLAIIQWIDELVPAPTLLPGSAMDRARIRQLAETVNSGTQPLQNLGAQYRHSDDPVERKKWAQHWNHLGLDVYEKLVRSTAGSYSFGDTLTLADLCLIPQCYNARRFDVDVSAFPIVSRIEAAALKAPSCVASHPDRYAPAPRP